MKRHAPNVPARLQGKLTRHNVAEGYNTAVVGMLQQNPIMRRMIAGSSCF